MPLVRRRPRPLRVRHHHRQSPRSSSVDEVFVFGDDALYQEKPATSRFPGAAPRTASDLVARPHDPDHHRPPPLLTVTTLIELPPLPCAVQSSPRTRDHAPDRHESPAANTSPESTTSESDYEPSSDQRRQTRPCQSPHSSRQPDRFRRSLGHQRDQLTAIIQRHPIRHRLEHAGSSPSRTVRGSVHALWTRLDTPPEPSTTPSNNKPSAPPSSPNIPMRSTTSPPSSAKSTRLWAVSSTATNTTRPTISAARTTPDHAGTSIDMDPGCTRHRAAPQRTPHHRRTPPARHDTRRRPPTAHQHPAQGHSQRPRTWPRPRHSERRSRTQLNTADTRRTRSSTLDRAAARVRT